MEEDKQNKRSVLLAALSGGGLAGGASYAAASIINNRVQSFAANKHGFESPGGYFKFSESSHTKWTQIGMGLGFLAGSITAAMGAIEHNKKVDRFTDKIKAERLQASQEQTTR